MRKSNRQRKKELKELAKEQAREEKAREKEESKRERNRNGSYTIISYMFVILFVALVGWMVYFNVFQSDEFINSPYNTRQDTFADRYIRGDIKSSDGEILATTQVYEDGSEERYYPYSNMFAHVVGYASYGKSGLEAEANFQLLSSHSFFIEQIVNSFMDRKDQGDTVVSTLNVSLQSAAYQAMDGYRGAVVALEPSTGKILAMVSKPDFDPNEIEYNWDYLIADDANSSLLNRATQGQYPPGSTFKLVTALAYLRRFNSISNFSYYCTGSITVDDNTINCYNNAAHGQEDLAEAFAASCNTAFAQIGLDVGARRLKDTGESLLFNSSLPLSMDYQESILSISSSSGDPLLMQTAIGQGDTLVSPIHMAMIVSAIANDGRLMTPYLIDHVENNRGTVVSEEDPVYYKRLMTSAEAATLEDLMIDVVQYGTASALSGQSYTAAGKTGSAEYDEYGDSHSWFVGYSNVDNPDLVVAVIVEEGGTGSQTAVPIAKQIFDTYYYVQ